MEKTFDTEDCKKCGAATKGVCSVMCDCNFVKCKNCGIFKKDHHLNDGFGCEIFEVEDDK